MGNFSADDFFGLEKRLIDAGLDSDYESFSQIKERLKNPKPVNADEFARMAIYVVLASGFSQKTAKRKHAEIMEYLAESPKPSADRLLRAFNNKNKITAIIKLWQDRQEYRDGYYGIKSNLKSEILNLKLSYLSSLPHIGKITANHLARNLGENVFKRDVWIDRLLKKHGEYLLERLEKELNLPRGYIDVVLWKGCQNGMIELGK